MEYSSAILFELRNNGEMPLDDLMKEATGVNTFQNHTGDGLFCETLISLFKAQFIYISDK